MAKKIAIDDDIIIETTDENLAERLNVDVAVEGIIENITCHDGSIWAEYMAPKIISAILVWVVESMEHENLNSGEIIEMIDNINKNVMEQLQEHLK